jgi:hypothetical protein
MQTGSSETLIGLKVEIWKKTQMSLHGTELEGAWLYGLRVNNGDAVSVMRLHGRLNLQSLPSGHSP